LPVEWLELLSSRVENEYLLMPPLMEYDRFTSKKE